MFRMLAGAIAGAVAMFVIGFIFYATPLQRLETGSLNDMQARAVQNALSANLPETGTYLVPEPTTAAQTVMYGRGPVARVHFNSSGFPSFSAGALLAGLILDFVVALLIGLALIGIDGRVTDFGSRSRVAVFIAVGAAAFIHLGDPIWYHQDWGSAVYAFIADGLALAAAGLIMARLLPRPAVPAATAQPVTSEARRDDEP